ncbi:MAG: DUF1223 domain-containing protein [Pseudomonadota bacterium]
MKQPFPMLVRAAVATALTLAAGGAAAASCGAQSPAHRIAMLELYTSEGCSSCPPADRWVSELPAAGFTTDQVVPLAFHVDYWNYLGWPDRFAQPVFTERQRLISASNGISFVYTPELVLNGKVFRGLSHRRLRDALKEMNAQPPGAELAIRATPAAGSVAVQVDAKLRDGARAGDAEIFLALTENGLATEVKRGENAGRSLRHDFVVRAWRGPHRFGDGPSATIREEIPTAELAGHAGANLVALVQNRRTGEVLQSLALPLCPPS